MGLFDRFRTKSRPIPDDLNLEELLERSALDPTFRAQFYRTLPDSDLFVLTQESSIPEGQHTLPEESELKVFTLSDGRIPVFTSTDRIFDKQVIKEEVQFVSMNAKDLFRTLQGATLVLNPYSDYGKELIPSEIKKVLDGTILSESGRAITIQESTEVILGQPAKVPQPMLDALKTVFRRYPNVSKAYLGWIATQDTNDPPHYVIGIETGGSDTQLVNDAGFTAQQFLGPGELVDFIEIKEFDGVSGYLRSTKPFYVR
jgi:SseB protein C-terminal domain/SseB protein N-terminal domain